MDYEAFFEKSLDDLKAEGNYRVFADLSRHKGGFPRATRYTADGEPRHGPARKNNKCDACSHR